MSPELRAAFLLREYHGLDYAALANELGTVKSRLSRARAALRERLARPLATKPSSRAVGPAGHRPAGAA